jgi:Tol biopolymer transport system component
MLYSRRPRYSPNGKYIVYSRFTGDRMGGPGYTDAEIRIMKSDGSDDRRLVGDLSNPGQNHYSAFWSLDGQSIVFTRTVGCLDYSSEEGFKEEKRMINLDGSNEREFNEEVKTDIGPSSPVDKTRLTSKIPKGFRVGRVLLSKDKKKIVFSVWKDQRMQTTDGSLYNETTTEIWQSNSDGSNARRLSDGNAELVGWLQ